MSAAGSCSGVRALAEKAEVALSFPVKRTGLPSACCNGARSSSLSSALPATCQPFAQPARALPASRPP